MAIILLMIIAAGLIPFCAAMIYKMFYNRHLNSALEVGEGAKGRRWLSPLAVGLLTLAAEVLALIICVMLFSVNAKSSYVEIDSTQNTSGTYTQEEVAGGPYAVFDGREVKGYDLEKDRDGDFSYSLYTAKGKTGDMLPSYILAVEYKGEKKATDAYMETGFEGKDGASSEGEVKDLSDKYYAVIDTDNVKIYYVDQKTGELTPVSDKDYRDNFSKVTYKLVLLDVPEGGYSDMDEAMDQFTVDSFEMEFDRL